MGDSMRVGNVEVRAPSDGGFTPPPSRFMPDVPAEAWERYRAQHIDANRNLRLNLAVSCCAAAGRRSWWTSASARDTGGIAGGRLMDDLQEAGVAPEDIDQVVITHMHFDHIGWNTVDREGGSTPTFPRARYTIQRAEWDYWAKEESAERTMETLAYPVERAGQLSLVDPNHQPTPELTMLSTPGHVCILIASGDEQAVILGDVAHTLVQVTEPDWSIAADVDQTGARQSRNALRDRIEAEGLRVAAGHFPPPNFGRFVRLEGRRTWQAL